MEDILGTKPLAERMRPLNLEDYWGQEHLTNEGKPIYNFIKKKFLPSLIFWGPPGTGKTTLANILAKESGLAIKILSAVDSGVKELREAIVYSEKIKKSVLFVDEIHRFSKSQQDALLKAVEKGTITLIGATTENPGFEVNKALLSRCQVYTLNLLSIDTLKRIVNEAIANDIILKDYTIEVLEWESILLQSGGDARKLLNILELVVLGGSKESKLIITNQLVDNIIISKTLPYDKNGENHYDIISAFIKSIRGSHVDASLYWLARMLDSGEDPKFIARRILISASEDIGLANPNALLIANACFDAIDKLGMPEARIPLSQAVIYLAASPKSNTAYNAINEALSFVKKTGNLQVPLHLRNAANMILKELDYGKNYKYPHIYEENFVAQSYLPETIEGVEFWKAGNNPREKEMMNLQKNRWSDHKKSI